MSGEFTSKIGEPVLTDADFAIGRELFDAVVRGCLDDVATSSEAELEFARSCPAYYTGEGPGPAVDDETMAAVEFFMIDNNLDLADGETVHRLEHLPLGLRRHDDIVALMEEQGLDFETAVNTYLDLHPDESTRCAEVQKELSRSVHLNIARLCGVELPEEPGL